MKQLIKIAVVSAILTLGGTGCIHTGEEYNHKQYDAIETPTGEEALPHMTPWWRI